MKTEALFLSSEAKRALAKQIVRAPAGVHAAHATGAGAQRGEIPLAHYRFEHMSEYQQWLRLGERFVSLGIDNPYFACHDNISNAAITIAGRSYINYSGYNYLGLSGDPEISRAAKDAIDRYGTSVSASRIVSGEIPLHRELEQELAGLIDTEACLVFVSGYGTNVSTIGHLFGPRDLILHDALAHNSLVTGCRLSGARRMPFPHNDWEALDRLLHEHRGNHDKVLIVIEGVYSMDGDIPDVPKFIGLKARHKAFLMIDEAHSMGVLGPRGFGIREHFGLSGADVDLWMGTLSKSFASCGGYIAGSRAAIEYLKYTAPGAVLYSVGLSPANAAAALAAVHKMKAEPQRVQRLKDRAALFLSAAKGYGLNTGLSSGSAVIPIVLGNSVKSLKLAHRLAREGVNVQAMLYPSVPEDAARLRFFITTEHTPEQIQQTVTAAAQALAHMEAE